MEDNVPEDSTTTVVRTSPAFPIDQVETVGQFSFAPTTQTTVVTTTTTTTTNFPPLVLKAPHQLYRDPKLYPLAYAPTPPAVKRICFDLEGTPGYFVEADDASEKLESLQKESEVWKRSGGKIQTFSQSAPHFDTRAFQKSSGNRPVRDCHRVRSNTQANLHRSTSPVSISKAAELARNTTHQHAKGVGKRAPRRTTDSLTAGTDATQNLRPFSAHAVIPATPDTDHGGILSAESQITKVHTKRGQNQQTLAQKTPAPSFVESFTAGETLKNSLHHVHNDTSFSSLQCGGVETERDGVAKHRELLQTTSVSLSSLDSGEDGGVPLDGAAEEARPRLGLLDTTAAQDISLPSPSLSPVTAAANLQRMHAGLANGNPHANPQLGDGAELLSRSQDSDSLSLSSESSSVAEHGTPFVLGMGEDADSGVRDNRLAAPSMMDIPNMMKYFEAVPDEMKSFVMFQLLRRCPRPTLQFVADTVNPALKCDFLTNLPFELALNIINFLDVRSLCRAAQVSKKWRQLIDSDERSWKRLFDRAGFNLPEGELQKAISEGWGWQCSSAEEDLSKSLPAQSGSELATTTGDLSSDAMLLGGSRRPKRKASSKYGSRKQTKRRFILRKDDDGLENPLLSQTDGVQGPYAAASAAAAAVPFANIGLQSLRNLHLYKSLFRRHYLIQKSWMSDAKPQHLCFRAHGRHVVTCLQFDSDKIITGSDDNQIHVYDTRTGALRAKLKGHEGGVWALQYVGNTLVSGSTDRTVRVWDIEKHECTQVFQGHTSTVRCLQIVMPAEVGRTANGRRIILPERPLLVTGSRDSNIRIWNLPRKDDPIFWQTGNTLGSDDNENPFFIRALSGHTHSVRAVAAYADTLISGSYDTTVRVWRISTGELLHRLQGHTQKVYSVVLDHDRNRCISGSMDNFVKVWSLDNGALLYNLEGHTSLVGLLDLNNNRLVSAAADSTLRIWDPETGQCKSTLTAHTGAITCFQHDATKVISGSDRTLKMWDIRTGECIKDLLTDLSGVWQVKFDERRCVAAVQRNNMTYIEVLDFGASRDGIPEMRCGRRITVNASGREVFDDVDSPVLDDEDLDNQDLI